jgi:hypothetical protein
MILGAIFTARALAVATIQPLGNHAGAVSKRLKRTMRGICPEICSSISSDFQIFHSISSQIC